MKLRVAGVHPESIVDGPGVRCTIFFQGCPHRCRGCHNPDTLDFLGGEECSVDSLLARTALLRSIDGVTISGGEPFAQAAAAAALARGICRRGGLNLVVYSGYTFEELYRRGGEERSVRELLGACGLLVDGPYRESERDLCLPYRGSRNQRLIDLPRSMAGGRAVPWEGGPVPGGLPGGEI